MSSLLIVPPLPIVGITASRGNMVERLLTGDPREAWQDTGGSGQITIGIDLGIAQQVDTLFLGFTNAQDNATIAVSSGVANAGETQWTGAVLPAPYLNTRPRRHGFAWRNKLIDDPYAGRIRVGDPILARYIDVRVTQGAGGAPLYAGNLCAGLAFQPLLGREYGGGRGAVDTGTRERLQAGGFGMSPGLVKAAWGFTMGDLTPSEVDRLWDIVSLIGETKSVLVVEAPDATPGLAERLHWSVFDKLESYERLDPANTRWAFRVEDWI